MRTRSVLAVLATALLGLIGGMVLAPAPAYAGNWAVTALDPVPDRMEPGKGTEPRRSTAPDGTGRSWRLLLLTSVVCAAAGSVGLILSWTVSGHRSCQRGHLAGFPGQSIASEIGGARASA